MLKFKAHKPKALTWAVFQTELEREANAIAQDILHDFESTVETWKTKPKFKLEVKASPVRVLFTVTTTDQVYRWVTLGTKKHLIRAKGVALRFQSGYKAKTKPGLLGSQAGGASGAYVVTPVVHHPGIEPRKFSELITRKWRPNVRRRMQAALRRAAQLSGHSRRR